MNPQPAAGLDVGSLSTEAVLVDHGGRIIAYTIRPTGHHCLEAAEEALAETLNRVGIRREELGSVVATGYGRNTVSFAHKRITEITCHAAGTHHLFPEVRTLIDVGGQDSKVIRLDARGRVMDFTMNDKCAAGTGRFLEVMAAAFGMGVEEMGPYSLKARKEISISSVCTVFAESEVVSLIAQNVPREEIIRGLHQAIVHRIWSMAETVGIQSPVGMSGGVAKNRGIVSLLEERLGETIKVYEEPQIVGALGAALLALEL